MKNIVFIKTRLKLSITAYLKGDFKEFYIFGKITLVPHGPNLCENWYSSLTFDRLESCN